ncbi:hypothetical protein Tco_1536611, partial [Tanacetum coccineum]
MDGDFGVECFPSGRGYRGRVRWKWVRVSWKGTWESGIARKPWEKGCLVLARRGYSTGWVAGFKRDLWR